MTDKASLLILCVLLVLAINAFRPFHTSLRCNGCTQLRAQWSVTKSFDSKVASRTEKRTKELYERWIKTYHGQYKQRLARGNGRRDDRPVSDVKTFAEDLCDGRIPLVRVPFIKDPRPFYLAIAHILNETMLDRRQDAWLHHMQWMRRSALRPESVSPVIEAYTRFVSVCSVCFRYIKPFVLLL